MRISWGHLCLAWWAVLASTAVSTAPQGPPPTMRRTQVVPAARVQTATVAPRANPAPPSKAFVDTYCATCHNQRLKTAGLLLDTMDVANVAAQAPECG